MTDRGYRLAFILFLLLFNPWNPLIAQGGGDPTEGEAGDTVEVEEWEDEWDDEEWDDVPVSDPEPAPSAGGFGLYGGPSFELFQLSTSSLDPDLDQDLILFGGYGFVVLSNIVVGGGGAGTSLEQPNEKYDRFSYDFGGFLTGYDQLITDDLSVRATILVGGGKIEMVKKRSDLSILGPNEFLERFRAEEFFLLRPSVSIGYSILGFIDLRASASRLLPIGGENASELGDWAYGLNVFFGFRNSISVN